MHPTLRSLYTTLLRLHPADFHQRFGDEMMSIFDEPGRRQSSLRLVADAFLSMLRQHLFRPEAPHGIEQLQRKARLVNMVWTGFSAALYVAATVLVNPDRSTKTAEGEFFYAILPMALFMALYRIFSASSIFPVGDPETVELERKLDTSQKWAARMGPFLIGSALVCVSAGIIALLSGHAPGARSWWAVNLVVLSVQMATFFAIVKRPNQRAARALQQQIAARRAEKCG